MEDPAALHRLGVALAIGLLVGAERHWRLRAEEAGRRTAGVRTFGLSGLLGGLAGMLAAAPAIGGGTGGGALLLGVCFLGHAGVVALFDWREAQAAGRFSVTTVVAAQATFLLGALAVMGDPAVAGAAAVAMTALLAARESLHAFLARLSWIELRSAVLLLAMTLVALPLVPDRPVAMLAGLNPAQVWMMAVILAAVSFLGYAAIRLFGARAGLALAGAAAGLVSSTAATLANARASVLRGGPGAAGSAAGDGVEAGAPLAGGARLGGALAGGALAAGSVSCLRTAVLALLGAPAVGAILAPALLAAAAVQGVAAVLLLRRGAPGVAPEGADRHRGIGNPFELRAVLQLAALLALVMLLSAWAARAFGAGGALAVAAVTGLADVDAVTLALPGLVPERLTPAIGAAMVGVAVAANGLAKAVYAALLGTRGYALRFAAGTLAGVALGALVLALRFGDP